MWTSRNYEKTKVTIIKIESYVFLQITVQIKNMNNFCWSNLIEHGFKATAG